MFLCVSTNKRSSLRFSTLVIFSVSSDITEEDLEEAGVLDPAHKQILLESLRQQQQQQKWAAADWTLTRPNRRPPRGRLSAEPTRSELEPANWCQTVPSERKLHSICNFKNICWPNVLFHLYCMCVVIVIRVALFKYFSPRSITTEPLAVNAMFFLQSNKGKTDAWGGAICVLWHQIWPVAASTFLLLFSFFLRTGFFEDSFKLGTFENFKAYFWKWMFVECLKVLWCGWTGCSGRKEAS